MRQHSVRLEKDRHYECTPTKCKAPTLRRQLAVGRNVGACVPRRTWWLRYTDLDGKRRSEGYKSEEQARREWDVVDARLRLKIDPRSVVTKNSLFKDMVDDALRSHAGTRSLRPTTLENHNNIVQNHLLPFFGEYPVDADHFDRAAIRRFIVHLRSGDGKPRISR
jgi:hypothetical protein